MADRTEEIIRLSEEFCAHNYVPLPVVITKGKGVWVWDVEGKKYLDMLSTYSALNHGHRHPKILKALIAQAQKLTLTSRAFHNDQLGQFCKELAQFCGMEQVLLMNTGAEAVESALKIARKWGYQVKNIPENKAEIIVCQNNFHGRTITIVSFSSESQYREGFGPLTPGFKIIPFNDSYALEQAISPNTAAFLVEPIQGEGGIIVPSNGYLRKVRDICARHNVLLMLDEIQTGFGRTGQLFAFQYEIAKPDILILGKALGGGIFPVSAVLSSREIMSVLKPGDHGSTFGGNPLGTAVAREALRVLVEENLAEHALILGAYFIRCLKSIRSDYVKEVRGRGLLIGIELKPEARGARRFCEKLLEKGILCKETHEHVIRFAPPLIITKKEINWAMERIKKVLEV